MEQPTVVESLGLLTTTAGVYASCAANFGSRDSRLLTATQPYLRSRHYVTTPRALNLRGLFVYTLLPCLLRETMSLASCSYIKRVEGGIRESCIG